MIADMGTEGSVAYGFFKAAKEGKQYGNPRAARCTFEPTLLLFEGKITGSNYWIGRQSERVFGYMCTEYARLNVARRGVKEEHFAFYGVYHVAMKAFEGRAGNARPRSLGILELAEFMGKGCNADHVGKAVNGKRKVGDGVVRVPNADEESSSSSSQFE